MEYRVLKKIAAKRNANEKERNNWMGSCSNAVVGSCDRDVDRGGWKLAGMVIVAVAISVAMVGAMLKGSDILHDGKQSIEKS